MLTRKRVGEVVSSVETTTLQGKCENRFKFNGQQLDPITGQYYLRARFYAPAIARFTQEDTYRGDGLNLYAYCDNNPVFYVDPSGYEAFPCEELLQRLRNAQTVEKQNVILDDAIKNLAGYTTVTQNSIKDKIIAELQIERVLNKYQDLVDKHDQNIKGNSPRHKGTLVHNAVAKEMKLWFKKEKETQPKLTNYIDVEVEVAFLNKKRKGGKRSSRMDLLIENKIQNDYIVVDLKTGKAEYKATQMAKNQSNLLGIPSKKQNLPNVKHIEVKPKTTRKTVYFK